MGRQCGRRMTKNHQSITKSGLLLVVVMVSRANSALGDLKISPGSQYCKLHPAFLLCDFLGVQELAVLESLAKHGGQTVNTVHIHNAEEVVVMSDICISLMAFNVGNITYRGIPGTCTPNKHFSFKLVDSSSNLVPPYISQLDMLRSVAEKVNIDHELKSFSVVSSNVGNLNIFLPVTALNIKIEHSVIDNFEKLHLLSKSQLVLYNATINKMSKSSLYLKESSVTIWTGNIKTSLEQAIILGPRASVTLKDTDGKVSLAGLQSVPPTAASIQQEPRPPGVPSLLPPKCNVSSSLVWAFPTVLAAVEAIIIIINCTKWFPSLKGNRVPRGLEEGDQSTRKTRTEGDSSYSTWYYNTEVPFMNVNRRQNVEYDKYA